MARRMDKYHSEQQTNPKTRVTRNELLYEDLNNKIGYEEVIDLDTTQAKIDLNMLNQKATSREQYHQIRDYQELIKKEEPPKKEEIKEEKKTFDINQILEEAKKNRDQVDDLEKRRNLKDEEYNVLANLNKKYLHKKEPEKEEGEIKELIDTITSNTLREEIRKKQEEEKEQTEEETTEEFKTEDTEKELLSDLLATKTELSLKESLAKEILESPNEEDIQEDTKEESKTEENSFYTKSMDLSEHDFIFSDEIEKEGSIGRKILIGLVIFVLLALIIVMTYLILKHLGISL